MISVADIKTRKHGEKIVCLTAYNCLMADILDKYADILLVGDSMGMVLYGLPSTNGLPLDVMVWHTKSVTSKPRNALVVADMTFGSYQESKEQAFRSAAKLMAEGGAGAVKLEGGQVMAETVEFLVSRGIPVMGHVGLLPQSAAITGYKAQGRGEAEIARLVADANALEKAGVFAIVCEAVTKEAAEAVVDAVSVPVIGIGASDKCAGQVLVTEDFVGLTDGKKPRFVKKYASTRQEIEKAAESFSKEIKSGNYPESGNLY